MPPSVPPCSPPSSASAPPHAAALRVTVGARGGPWAASGRGTSCPSGFGLRLRRGPNRERSRLTGLPFRGRLQPSHVFKSTRERYAMSGISEMTLEVEELRVRFSSSMRALIAAQNARNDELVFLKHFVADLLEIKSELPAEIAEKLDEVIPSMLAKERITSAADEVTVAILEAGAKGSKKEG